MIRDVLTTTATTACVLAIGLFGALLALGWFS